MQRIVSRLRRIWTRPPSPAAVPAGWLPITQTESSDIFLVAYPKSGMTWLQCLIAGAIYGLDPALAPDRLTQDLVPDVHYKRCYKRYRTPMFFKSHHLPRPEYRRVVYLIRDGRDVMVSYWHHLRALGRRDLDLATLVGADDVFPSRWHEHVAQWQANPFAAEILWIRYEDLLQDAARELDRICAFVGEPRDPAMLARVAAQCRFAVMQRREQRFGWDNAAWPRDTPFVRRGVRGSYRDEMPVDALRVFMAEAGPALREYGYDEPEA